MSEEVDLDTGETRAVPEQDHDAPKADNKQSSRNSKRPKIPLGGRTDGRTKLRRGLTPYLPPPVIKAMNKIDPVLEPYVGPEPSITITSSLLLCFFIVQFIKVLSSISRGGKAIADDDDDGAVIGKLNQTDDFGDTVILVGPMGAGKTRIFYHLCYGDPNLQTVMSLRANAALLPVEGKEKPVRVLDYPGHAGLSDPLFAEMMHSKPVPRIVAVVDSTQNMSQAADVFYDLFQHVKDKKYGKPLDVFVACHKADLSTAKNPRRVKIQLRTELEKLIEVRAARIDNSSEEGESPWWTKGESLDLDNLKYARLHFEDTLCNTSDGIDKLAEFAKTGVM